MEKLKLAYSLMIESVYKPDSDLRTQAKEAGCYDELMSIRKSMIQYLESCAVFLDLLLNNVPQTVSREAFFNAKNFPR